MDFPPGFDPNQVNYISGTDQAIGALITLLALASLGAAVTFTEVSGAAFIDVQTGLPMSISLEEANQLVAAEMLGSGQTVEVFDAWSSLESDAQFTSTDWGEYLNNTTTTDSLNFTGDFGLSQTEQGYLQGDWFPWEQQ